MELAKLRFQNRHWDNIEVLREDIHLKQLFSAPLILRHPAEEKLRLNEDKVHIIRGPRQIGKTSPQGDLLILKVDFLSSRT